MPHLLWFDLVFRSKLVSLALDKISPNYAKIRRQLTGNVTHLLALPFPTLLFMELVCFMT